MSTNNKNAVVEINVGGHVYTTTIETLTEKYSKSKLANSIMTFQAKNSEKNQLIPILQDAQGRMFIDRDGYIFKFILDYLRRERATTDWVEKMIPDGDHHRFRAEAAYFGLSELAKEIDRNETGAVLLRKSSAVIREAKAYGKSTSSTKNDVGISRQASEGPLASGDPYFISIGYRGYYTADRDSPSNDLAKFRRITRITVSGRSDVAKEVFQDELNESRDPARFPPQTYTCRYYLKHNYLEYAFETLVKSGFELVSSTSTGNQTLPATNKEFKQWSTYVEYLFYRKPCHDEQVSSKTHSVEKNGPLTH